MSCTPESSKFPPKPKAATATLRPLKDSPVTNGDAEPLREVTRRYLEALEAQRTKDNLLAVAAHELRHPLHVMRMAIARHLDDKSPVRHQLDRYLQRMARLIDEAVVTLPLLEGPAAN